jgi:hypothetical protein
MPGIVTIPSVPDADTPAVVVVLKTGSVTNVTGTFSVAPMTGLTKAQYWRVYSDVVFTILPANVGHRVTYKVQNISKKHLYLYNAAGADIGTHKYFVRMPPYALYEEPTDYDGIVTGIFEAGGDPADGCTVEETNHP